MDYGGQHGRPDVCKVTWVYTAPIMAVSSMAPGPYLIEDSSLPRPAAFVEVASDTSARPPQLVDADTSSPSLASVDVPSGSRADVPSQGRCFRALRLKTRRRYSTYKRFPTTRHRQP